MALSQVRGAGARVRERFAVFLGFVAILGLSLPALLPPAPDLYGENLGSEPSLAGAGDGDAPRDAEDDLEERGRNVTVEVVDDRVNIELESQSPEPEDEVDVQFGAGAAQLRVSFETLTPQHEEVEMRIEFRDLVEFEDADGDGAFSPLDDEILRWMRVESLGILSPPEVEPFSSDSTSGHRISVTYGIPGSGTGAFELIFRVVGLPTQVNGVHLGPTETKIDIRFSDFPFASSTSQLALGLEVRTNFELEMDPSLAFDQINATGEEFAAFFRWMPEAVEVDGVTSAAEVTVVREAKAVETQGNESALENELRLFLAYPRGSLIVHDPIVGITAVAVIPPLPVDVPSIAPYAIGLGTALLLVVGMWALHRRRS